MLPESAEIVVPASRVLGRLTVPGDKSISHRHAILAALASGRSRLHGFAEGADARATLECLRGLGVTIHDDGHGNARVVEIDGRGWRNLQSPQGPLDAANSGTTLRLLAGVLAAHPFTATLTGDASLRRRPMRRIIEPLERMGARVTTPNGMPPLTVSGTELTAIDYETPVPSAQVKGAVLLAGIQASGRTVVTETITTRDHTERALGAFGASIQYGPGWAAVDPSPSMRGITARVPGDLSSAACWAVAAACRPGSDVEILDVGLNPTRTAFLRVLERAGAVIEADAENLVAGEPVGRLRVRYGALRPIVLGPPDVPGVIDELPLLAALATAGGALTVTGASELRVKESDRITALVAGLRALGADAHELADGFIIQGARPLRGGRADAAGDHRLAMAFAIAALGAESQSRIDGAGAVDVSYPGFFETLRSLTA